MKRTSPRPTWTRAALWLLPALAIGLLSGCATPYQTAGLVVGGVTGVGARVPTPEMEQIYYLGVFDPTEQVPPSIYRITVRGQASILNRHKFASGWVPAGLIDSLGGGLSMDMAGGSGVQYTAGDTNLHAKDFKVGRRLKLFGPEGFREAPANHRLVIVMGSSPDAYFQAVDEALGTLSTHSVSQSNSTVLTRLIKEFARTRESRNKLLQLQLDAASALQPK